MKYISKLTNHIITFCDTETLHVLPYFVITFLEKEDKDRFLEKTGKNINCIVEFGWLSLSVQAHF